MGIRFTCPNGHKLHVKTFLAGKRGVCPQCGAKILIPAESQPEQIAPLASIQPEQVTAVPSFGTIGGRLSEFASTSVVIAVTDSSVADLPVADAPAPLPPATVADLPPVIPIVSVVPPSASPPAVAAPLVIGPNAVEPVSPAVRYVAQRERNRRKQVVFAVMLLLAVIVLAGVLIFVLNRGTGSSPAPNSQASTHRELSSSREAAVLSHRSQNAHSALVEN